MSECAFVFYSWKLVGDGSDLVVRSRQGVRKAWSLTTTEKEVERRDNDIDDREGDATER